MFKKLLIFSFIVFIQPCFSEPVKVAVSIHTPPFVFQTSNQQFYGFDISMMRYLCSAINRPCQFTAMPFKRIINNVETGSFDLGVSSITITQYRAQKVRFSTPYLPSYYQFMVRHDFTKPNTLETLQNSSIGYLSGSIFPDILTSLGIKNPGTGYSNTDRLIEALHHGKIEMIISDPPIANYWVSLSHNKFKLLDKPVQYGLGIAIAIRPDQPELVKQINQALAQYLNSKAFLENYKHFLQNDLSLSN